MPTPEATARRRAADTTFARVKLRDLTFTLDLLPYASQLRRRRVGVNDEVWCLVRRRWVVTQPEELVRQALIAHLYAMSYPLALMQLERAVRGSANRVDLVVHDRAGAAWLLAEVKSPEVSHLAGVAQLADYSRTVQAPYCLVANGREAICVALDYQAETLRPVRRLPAYPLAS